MTKTTHIHSILVIFIWSHTYYIHIHICGCFCSRSNFARQCCRLRMLLVANQRHINTALWVIQRYLSFIGYDLMWLKRLHISSIKPPRSDVLLSIDAATIPFGSQQFRQGTNWHQPRALLVRFQTRYCLWYMLSLSCKYFLCGIMKITLIFILHF